MNANKHELKGQFVPKTEIGRDGALRRHRAVQARKRSEAHNRACTIRSARWTRAEAAQRVVSTSIFTRPTSVFGFAKNAFAIERSCSFMSIRG
jgi:hypothetical protein